MRPAITMLGITTLLFGAHGIVGNDLSSHSTEGKARATALILASQDGERREFRTRPGTFFTVKVDPQNGGSEHIVVIWEDMAPGDGIPTHLHPDADELILIHEGTAKVTLGDKIQEAHAGAMVFIPKNTWIGVENVGSGHLISTGVLSAPGYEDYLRAISVPAGQPVVPLSMAELDELRKKHASHAIYQ